MDIWLLAAHMVLGGAVIPRAEADHGLAVGPTVVALRPADAEPCIVEPTKPELACPPAAQTMAATAPDSHDAAVPPLSMGAVVTGGPRPEAVMPAGRLPSLPAVRPNRPTPPPQDYRRLGPVTGAQLYQLRTATLLTGQLYTQVVAQQYLDQWQLTLNSPTYDQWQALLAQEAETTARIQGQRALSVVVGDSLALWLPTEALPAGQIWLNQSISGETTAHMLRRLHYFAATRPRAIHVMAGINDLKNGATEAEVLDHLYTMLADLKQQHPQARLVVYSLLPTRLRELPSDRIQRVNQRLATLAAAQGATFIDLYPLFSDSQGQLRLDLTTDGLHLSPQGYALWREALVSPGPGL